MFINDFLMTSLASACVGISVFCFLRVLFSLMENLELDKEISYEAKRSLPLFFKLFMPFTPNVRFFVRSNALKGQVDVAEDKVMMAGFSHVIDGESFVGVRLLIMLFSFGLMIMCVVAGRPMAGLIMAACLIIYPTVWLNKKVAQRHLEIMKALPNVLDLLTLSVEAGKDFLTSMRDILSRRRMDALGEELGRTFKEIQLGKKREDALRDLAKRVKQPDLTSVCNAIVQAEELGVSIGHLLRVQSEMLRNKRFTRAEKLANEAPVKILLPMILFIFPAVFIILMVPIAMQASKYF
jgi:tight adherence protein C